MIYEFRTYTFFPGKLPEFIAAFEAEALPILAPCFRGLWRSESGALNRAIHLWEFENREERARIKAGQAPQTAGFAKKVLPLMRKQQSQMFEGKLAIPSVVNDGVFDLMSVELPALMEESVNAELMEIVTAWLSRHFRVIAALREEWGSNLTWLLRSNSLRNRDENWRGALSSRPASAQTAKISRLQTDLLLPVPFSPLR